MTAPAIAATDRAPIDRLTGASRALRREKTLRAQIFHPPPRYSVSEWSDRHRYLSRMSSAEEGRWRTARAPYQRGIMDAISDPTVQRVAWMAPSQCGKSETLLCTIGYYIDQDPAPMLMVQPSIEAARDFSEDRIKTMIEVSPRLRAKVVVPSGRREAGNKMLRKAFPGGHLTLVGANSATGLASRPIRVVLFDEVDKYPPSAGDKGDPISLASNRTKTFWNRKIVIVTTPGVKGASRIEKEWAESDQRRYFVPCPHCGHLQHLQWARVQFDDGTYCCESCACTIEERHKGPMLAKGEWVATNPNGSFPGFHLNALYSPWTTWKEMIAKFLVAKKAPDTLRVFVNEDLAELWDPNDGDAFDTDTLKSRREVYATEVPNDVGVLTAFVDVQRDWLELTVRGWCAGQRSYLIAHHRIQGDPGLPHVWDRLDVYRTKDYQHESGATLKIAALGVDSGDGQTVQHVYRYVSPRQKQGVYATKGLSVRGRPISNRPAKRNKYGVRVFPVGTDTAKDLLFQRLKIVKSPDAEAPPGYLHFPMPLPEGGCDDEYLDQFGREQVFIRHVHGVPIREYHTVPKGARNEAVDLEVGCIAMLHLLGAAVYDQLSVWAAKVQAEGAKLRPAIAAEGTPAPAIIAPVIPKAPRPFTPRRGGYVNRWRG